MRSEGGLRARKRPNQLLLEAYMGVRAALTELKAVTWAKPKAVWGQTCPYPWQFHLAGHLHFWGPHPAFRIPRLLPSPPTFLPLSLSTTNCPVLENSNLFHKTLLNLHFEAPLDGCFPAVLPEQRPLGCKSALCVCPPCPH